MSARPKLGRGDAGVAEGLEQLSPHLGSVTAVTAGPHVVLRATGPSLPNVLAAVLLSVRDQMPEPPHVYFEWSESGPAQNALRFLFGGEGDVPPLTHEVPRRAEPEPEPEPDLDPDPDQRPRTHAGR